MATIIENLKKILEARYGKDVRQAIHDSIENCYNDGKAGSIDLQARHDIEEMGTEIATVESIAKGKNQARVFSTTESMENWLSDSANKGVANVGDNLYIVAVDVPDWWISSVLEAPNESGMYYEIAQLETQKVDITTIESAINSIDSKIGSTDISAIGDGTVTGGLDALNSNLKTSDNIILKCGTARKSGNTVQLDILFDGTISGGTHGGTMPIGYRPRNLACSPIVCGPSLNSIGRVEVNSTGEIYLYSHIEIQYARGIVTYCI